MSGLSIVFVMAGKEEEARGIGRALVEEKLIACVNIIPGVRSIYRWKGKIWDEGEFMMIMKTRSSLVASVISRVRELHSYEVPEIVAFPIAEGLPEYLAWAVESTIAPG